MIRTLKKIFLPCYLLFNVATSFSQEYSEISGFVKDTLSKPIANANVIEVNSKLGAITNDSGFYQLKVQKNKEIVLNFSSIGYTLEQRRFKTTKNSEKIDIVLLPYVKELDEVKIITNDEREAGISKISIRDFKKLPNPSGNFESLIKTQMGVSSSNELSSQYSVRGGSFDENLIYVNDIEIVRPFLIRSGQQEGLSFINPDMVSSVRFSAGGFEARYGDKMSSALDVSYRRPTQFGIDGTLSMLGGNLTMEGISKNRKFSQISGLRYRTSKYLLNTFDTKGEYNPQFIDFQTFLIFKPAEKLEFNFLSNYAQNSYEFIPETRVTNFGTVQTLYNFRMYFDGKELDRYRSALGAFTFSYSPSSELLLKFIASGYTTYEQETYDIDGQYLINELDNTPGSISYKDSLLYIGVGSMLTHARNYLWMDALTYSHIGIFEKGKHTLRWSIQAKQEWITDRLNEWELIDSADHSLPYHPDKIVLSKVANAKNDVNSIRYSGYIQDSYKFDIGSSQYSLIAGIRYNYWTFSKEFLLSPRLRITYQPPTRNQTLFYIATGAYPQPPVYREMRDSSGNLNPNIKAQKSYHIVIGNDYYLNLWDRPFKLTSEIYYKYLTDLIPYKLDNTKPRYTARNNARGYAIGADMKLIGEFVPGIESWLCVSFLKTEEDILDDNYYDKEGTRHKPGYYSRPTDQRFNLNLFFQDYLPNNPTLQVHLNFVYGSSLYVSPTRFKRYDVVFPLGPYRRVDLGFTKTLKKADAEDITGKKSKLKELLLGVEIFNLLNINNKASLLWVRTTNSQTYEANEVAVPNYLTSRRLNVKLSFRF